MCMCVLQYSCVTRRLFVFRWFRSFVVVRLSNLFSFRFFAWRWSNSHRHTRTTRYTRSTELFFVSSFYSSSLVGYRVNGVFDRLQFLARSASYQAFTISVARPCVLFASSCKFFLWFFHLILWCVCVIDAALLVKLIMLWFFFFSVSCRHCFPCCFASTATLCLFKRSSTVISSIAGCFPAIFHAFFQQCSPVLEVLWRVFRVRWFSVIVIPNYWLISRPHRIVNVFQILCEEVIENFMNFVSVFVLVDSLPAGCQQIRLNIVFYLIRKFFRLRASCTCVRWWCCATGW